MSDALRVRPWAFLHLGLYFASSPQLRDLPHLGSVEGTRMGYRLNVESSMKQGLMNASPFNLEREPLEELRFSR